MKPAHGPSASRQYSMNEPTLRVGDRHLAEHPHHEHDEQAGRRVGEDRRRAGLVHHRAGAHEQAGADDPAEGDHRHVPLAQALLELAGAVSVAAAAVMQLAYPLVAGLDV